MTKMARVNTAQKPKTTIKNIDPVYDVLLSPIDSTMFQSTSDNSEEKIFWFKFSNSMINTQSVTYEHGPMIKPIIGDMKQCEKLY